MALLLPISEADLDQVVVDEHLALDALAVTSNLVLINISHGLIGTVRDHAAFVALLPEYDGHCEGGTTRTKDLLKRLLGRWVKFDGAKLTEGSPVSFLWIHGVRLDLYLAVDVLS